MLLSIIIVNYNVKYFLEQCLLSVKKAIEHIHAEVIVFDNNSSDGSKEYLSEQFSWVTFIWSSVNHGFGKANNIAFNEANGKYILFLNPDTIVAEDTFIKCLDYFESHSLCGAMGVRMIDGSGAFLKESRRSFPSPLNSFYKLAGLTALFPKSKIFAGYYSGNKSVHESCEVDVIAGAFMMIPKNVLKKTGVFDEAFFMYGEDIDLSYRITKCGYSNIYFADTTIIHFKGESTRRSTLNYVKVFYKAMLIFVKKHYNSFPSLLYLYLLKIAIALRAVLAITFRAVRQVKANLSINKKNITTSETMSIIGSVNNLSLHEQLECSGKNILSCYNEFITDEFIKMIEQENRESILICEGDFISFKTLINLMEVFKNKKYIHADGSDVIISSDDKHATGEIIAIESKQTVLLQ